MQKQWLIDAHNVMHLLPPVVKGYGNNRLDGIEYLSSLIDGVCMKQKRKALLVFDGYPLHLGMKHHNCRIAFSGGKTADEAIINRLKNKNSAEQWIVVSNDREVLSQARMRGAETTSANEFARQVSSKATEQQTEENLPQTHPQKRADVEVSDNEVEEMLRLFNKHKS
ncbi:MAG: NYN domain-containing protein [Balneolales bacterium]